MRRPHIHITGVRGWLQHHHEATTIDGADAAVRLLTGEEADDAEAACDASSLDAWLRAWRGGVVLPRSWARGGCDGGAEVLVPEADGGGLRVLSVEGDRPYTGALLDTLADTRFAATDHLTRAWFLSGDGQTLRAFDAELRVDLAELALPEPVDLFAVGPGGLVVARRDGTAWWRRFDGTFGTLDLGVGADETLASVAPLGHSFLALVVDPTGRGRLIEVRDGVAVSEQAVAGLDCPTFVIAVDDDEFYLVERDGAPPAKTRMQRFAWRSGLLAVGPPRELRGFDGRIAFVDSGGLLASFAGGLRALYAVRPRYTASGYVETVHLDAGRALCQWDRVFLDVCIPQGCKVGVEARTAETLDPPDLVVDPVPPPGLTRVDGPGQMARLDATLTETAGWQTVLGFDDLGPDGDASGRGIIAGRDGVDDGRWTTIEGFIPNEPGRYLWLRIRLEGTRRATPRVYACRTTYPRPDVLALLPAFWQRDPDQAAQMRRFLALFEAELTRTDALIRHLHYLFDPRSTPPDVLEWLASWVGVGLDDRIPLSARRALVREAVELYRTRGTVGGLTRVIEIVSGVEAVIVEGFRVRRADHPTLGVGAGTLLGDVLPLGGSPPVGDDVTPRLVAGWQAGMVRRERHRRAHGQPCPEDAPESPALTDEQAYYAAYAHRFSVVLIGDVCDERLAATEDAIAAWKPAHTLHSVCVTDAGVRVGQTARPGYAAISADDAPAPPPAVLGQPLPLGAVYTLGPHTPLRTVAADPDDTQDPR